MHDFTDQGLTQHYRNRRIKWVADNEGEGGHWSLDPQLSLYSRPLTGCQPARAPEWKSANRLNRADEKEAQ